LPESMCFTRFTTNSLSADHQAAVNPDYFPRYVAGLI
jgi:hypothetical protein